MQHFRTVLNTECLQSILTIGQKIENILIWCISSSVALRSLNRILRSLINIRNSNGDKGSPCLTPIKVSNVSERLPLYNIQQSTDLHIACTILTNLLKTPPFSNLIHKAFLSNESSSFRKSTNAQYDFLLQYRLCIVSDCKMNK